MRSTTRGGAGRGGVALLGILILVLQIGARLHTHGSPDTALGYVGDSPAAALSWTAAGAGAPAQGAPDAEPFCRLCLGLSQARHLASAATPLRIAPTVARDPERAPSRAPLSAGVDLWSAAPRSPPAA